jgi:hypothetical protein
MIGFLLIAAVALIAAGTVVGFLFVLALGIHREERDYSFTVRSPSRLASGVRAATGAYARRPGVSAERAGQNRSGLALVGPVRPAR